MSSGTFSESWYRIADRHASLRPHLTVRRQVFRGERWYVIQDPINNQFFRLRPAAYDFLARLRLDRTIEEVWQECVERKPDEAPGQEDVIRLLAQLYQANLLHSDMAADSQALFERYRQRREREIQSRFLSIMFARIPLIDPDNFLKRCMPVAKWILSPWGAVLWLLVVGAGIKVAIDHADALGKASNQVLAPDNLVLLYLGFAIIKTIHEFGHAFMCRRFGGEVHTMGIMFMIFTPIPYVDATSAWAFRSRLQRMLVGAGGMIPEVFVAALMTFVWANTGEGTLHNLAYNMMFVASVSTVVFNANPLMRFDGYYILSDLLGIPNLNMRSYQMLGYLAERYLFGRQKAESPAHNLREAWWLAVFGVAASIYRTVVFAIMLFFMFGRYLILGVIMATVCGIAWLLVPLTKFVQYLANSPRLERQRPRAVAVTLVGLALLVVLLDVIPFPSRFRAPGILEAAEHTIVANESPGYIQTVLATPGSPVTRGQPLIKLFDPELEFQLTAARAQLAEAQAMELRALREQTADLQPIRSRLESLTRQLARLEEQERQLTVLAAHDGKWIAPDLDRVTGAWLARGTPMGHLVNDREFHFQAVVSQRDASRLFANQVRSASVRLQGQAGEELVVVSQKIIPAEHTALPSAALGWAGGGEVAVELNDPSGVRATEPFFELRATVQPKPGVAIVTGRSGKIRFDLPPEPLLRQWVRQFLQLVQKHYGI